jgi:hypothetical protein
LLQTFESLINISEEHPEPEPCSSARRGRSFGRFLCKAAALGLHTPGMAGFEVEKWYFRGDVVVHAWYREDRVAD